VLIYGNCRYEDQGCTFNHDNNSNKNSSQADFGPKKSFNVESPSFTPSTQQQQQASKKSTFSSQAASAAPFTPRASSTTPSLPQQNAEAIMFNPGSAREFTPATYDVGNTTSGNGVQENGGLYTDPFTTMNSLGQQLPSSNQFNPYAADPNSISGSGSTFYPQQYSTGPIQPPNYHLYQPTDGYRGDLQPWQRATYDFFLPKHLREEMQKKLFAAQQIIPGNMLPELERYHSLVPLDTNHRKSTSCFNYQSWMYKAKNNKNGRLYALRRLEGYRLTNEHAIQTVMKEWKRIKNACIVTVHEIFTSREFGDSSLIFAYDYHPLWKTLQELHFQQSSGPRFKTPGSIPEETLWGYICQITTALKAIHSSNLAARSIELSKIIVDGKRIKLAACSILDVVQFESGSQKSLQDLQQEDLIKFGKLMLSLATNQLPSHLNVQVALESLNSKYSQTLKEAIAWLISSSSMDDSKSIENFISGISSQMTKFFDLALQESDETKSHLSRELENGRAARIMMKLDAINDHPSLANIPNWSETGDRYPLKLFRDYVFHQVDRDGKACVSIGHMLTCINKLDAGIEELVPLTSPDNQTSLVISYRELRNMLERSFNELQKHSKNSGAP
jgi:PAB-dependent poly(A)-specific ribonuclease subunit 3